MRSTPALSSLGIAPDLRAVLVEDSPLVGERLRPTPHVPVIGVLGRDAERDLLAPAADHQLGVRLLHRLGHQRRVVETIEAALVIRARLGPERLQHPARLVQPLEPLAGGVEVHPVGAVLVLLPARAHAADEAAARDDVDVGRHLGEEGRMPVGVAAHDGADPQPLGARGERGERGPALERVAHPVRGVGHEVIGDAGRVPAGPVAMLPEGQHLVPRGAAHTGEEGKFHGWMLRAAVREVKWNPGS